MSKNNKKEINENIILLRINYIYMYLRYFIRSKLVCDFYIWGYQDRILFIAVVFSWIITPKEGILIVWIVFLLSIHIYLSGCVYIAVMLWDFIKYIYIGKTLKVSKCTKKISMSEKAKLQGYSMSKITNLFRKDFIKVYFFAKEKQWKSIKTSTHGIFVLEIFKGIGFKTEDIGCEYKQILENLQSDDSTKEWRLQDITLKIKKDKKMINRALVFTLGYKPTFEQLKDYCEIRQFYKVEIIFS